jgi:pimeloyl-ACP methyl ester carboxylesterase
MSGAITVEAARRSPERVVALVPVDTLQDADWDLPEEAWQAFFGGLRADFPNAVESFFRTRLVAPSSPPDVIDRIVAEARAAHPTIAVPMLERAREYDLRSALRALRIPIHALEAEANPANLEVNRKYAPRFEASTMPGVGHWPMLEAPEAFGDALAVVLEELRRAAG